jgi:hypothetical protein
MVKFRTGAGFSSPEAATNGQISDRCGVFEPGGGHQWSNFRPVRSFRARTRPPMVKFPTGAGFLRLVTRR